MPYDAIIVGAGPAAWSAATYLVRAGLKIMVIGKQEESGLFDAADVWNYPGFIKGLAGRDLLDRMMTQSIEQGAAFKKDEVTHIEKNGELGFLVRTSDRAELLAQNLILAHGANYIKVNVPGEETYKGKGVHYCALCDGPMYKEGEVVVIGNGNFAAEEAVQLSGIAHKVAVITNAGEPNFSQAYLDLFKKNKIEVINQRVSEIVGVAGTVTGVKLQPPLPRYESIGHKLAQEADGVFIAIGVASSFGFAQKLGLQMQGNFLKADEHMRTSVPGVWVAGLARGGVNQIVKSVGDGGIAAVDLIKTFKGLPQYLDHG